jgi:hypothetical protein
MTTTRSGTGPHSGAAATLRLILRKHEDPTRLVALGEIDISTEQVFAEALADAVSQAGAHEGRLVVDLTAVQVLSAAAVRTLERYRASLTTVLVSRHTVSGTAIEQSLLRPRLVYQPRSHSTGLVPCPRRR